MLFCVKERKGPEMTQAQGAPIEIKCACGALHLRLSGASAKNGTHAACYCIDCQAFARALGRGEILDAKGGTELFQTQPSRISVVAGVENLAVLQLQKKGLYRWFARCCDTPLCNTVGSAKVPFASFLTCNMDEGVKAIGPVKYRYKPEQALAPVDEPSGPLWRFAMRSGWSILKERLSGRWKQNPFFDSVSKRSIVKPRVLSDEERKSAYL